MDISVISAAIERARRQGRDDGMCEIKESTSELSNSIWATVSAFANTEGGLIILGLSEEKGFVSVDGFELDKVRDQFIEGMGDGGGPGRLTNPPVYSVQPFDFENRSILAIEINELDPSTKPCYITNRGKPGGCYKRIDDKDIRLSANEVYALENAYTHSRVDGEPVPEAGVRDLDEKIYEKIFSKAERSMPRSLHDANDCVTRLQRLGLINGRQEVTKAGLLTAGRYPQQFYPKLHIDIASHPGTNKADDSEIRFLDRVICEGTIGEMLEEAILAIARNLKRVSIVRGAGRSDELEIPEEVFREAIANALIHRDYDSRFDGEAISVNIYDDRIEVTNPGGLWGKSRADLMDGRSCCRNASLMRLISLSELPSRAGSPAEGNGTGILLMTNEMLKRNLRRPEFRPAIDHFSVVMYRPNARREKLSKRDVGEAKVASLLLEYGELSIHEIEEKTGLTINQVRSRIRDLINDGVVEATAPSTSRYRKYRFKRS